MNGRPGRPLADGTARSLAMKDGSLDYAVGTSAITRAGRAFLTVRGTDIARVYTEWSAKGAELLTEPKDHGREIRAYVRDPDGHLIEVGQT